MIFPDVARGSGAARETSGRRLARAAEVSLQLLIVSAAVIVLAFALFRLRLVVLPVIVAIFGATLLVPPANWLRRKGLPGALATALVLLGGLTVVAGLLVFIAPNVADELEALDLNVREGLDQVGEYLADGPLNLSTRDIDRGVEQAIDRLGENSGGIAESVFSGAVVAAELVAGLLLTLVLLFFFVKDGDSIWDFVVRRFPAAERERVRELGRQSWSTLGGYLRGVAIVATIDAVLIGILLAVVGVPLVLPLAVLTFFGAFFPLVGAFVAGLVAALVALVAQGPLAALIVVIGIVIIQQVEGDIVYPLVVGRAINLHPVPILLAITAGAVLAGVIGALVAVPVTAVLWTVLSSFGRDEPEPAGRPKPEPG